MGIKLGKVFIKTQVPNSKYQIPSTKFQGKNVEACSLGLGTWDLEFGA